MWGRPPCMGDGYCRDRMSPLPSCQLSQIGSQKVSEVEITSTTSAGASAARARRTVGLSLLWLLLTLSIAGATGTMALWFAGCTPAPTTESAGVPARYALFSVLILSGVAFSVLGTIIATYRPRNRIGWLCILIGLGLVVLTNFAVIAALLPTPLYLNGIDTIYHVENPFGLSLLPAAIGPLVAPAITSTIVLVGLLANASLVVHWRRVSGQVRQQIKWLVFFLATAVSFHLGIEIAGELFFSSILDSNLYLATLLVVFLGFPLVIGVSIFRYRLYAAMFSPLRRRLQETIDRRSHRRAYNATQILLRFAQTSRSELDPEALSQVLIANIEETMHPSHVSIWLRDR
jgi:hypothetical protein